MRFLVATSLTALLIACSGQGPAERDAAMPDTAAQSIGAAGLQAWHPVLPGDAELGADVHLRTHTIYQAKNGATRRRLVFELLDAPPDRAEAVIAASLARADYVGDEAKPGKSGRYSVRYRKKGAPTITATYHPELASSPANPEAQSMVTLTWQIKRAPRG